MGCGYGRAAMGNATNGFGFDDSELERVLDYDCCVRSIVDRIQDGRIKNIVVMAGAGISVSAGIPDFRTPGTGLYSNLAKYDLPTPQHVFDIDYFKKTDGEAFYMLAKEMWPDNFNPSPAHAFIKLLEDKGLLLRCFTQNIDTLERAAGVSGDKVVEAHGSFASASCVQCSKPFDIEECKQRIFQGKVDNNEEEVVEKREKGTPVRCYDCNGLVKPDIVFFGEGLPERFHRLVPHDFAKADLLMIMGTSLTVQPFARSINAASPLCPRLLINMKPVAVRGPEDKFRGQNGFRLRQHDNYRDAMIQGYCDDAVRGLADALGWREELESLIQELGCKVGSYDDAIDWNVSFPSMLPGGINYNWRVRTTKEHFPALKDARLVSSLDELEEAMQFLSHSIEQLQDEERIWDYSQHCELFVFRDSISGLKVIKGVLQMSELAKSFWDEDDYLAIVPSDCDLLTLDCHVGFDRLNSPREKQFQEGESNMLHRFRILTSHDDELELDLDREFHFWWVSNETGKVAARWGPFRFQSYD